MEGRTCAFCGGEIPPDRDPRRRFCGPECYHNDRARRLNQGTLGALLDALQAGFRAVKAISRESGLDRLTVRSALAKIPYFPTDQTKSLYECTVCHEVKPWSEVHFHVWAKHKVATRRVRVEVPRPDVHGTEAGYQAHRWGPGPTCVPCQDAHRDHEREAMRRWRANKGPVKSRRPVEHGTLTAYYYHLREETAVCDECRSAKRAYDRDYDRRRRAENPEKFRTKNREWYRRHRAKPRVPKIPRHGTVAGYARHLRFDEPPCDDCRLAYNEWRRAYRRKVNLARSD